MSVISPVPVLRSLQGYVVPPPEPDNALCLHGTERPCLQNHVGVVQGRYPDTRALEQAIATYLKVDAQSIYVTAGADESIDRLCRAYLNETCSMLTTYPTFDMIGYYARLTGARVDTVEWMHERFPIEVFLQAVKPDTRVIAIVSPNNPTGACIQKHELVAILEACSQCVVLLDHVYVEFAEHDLTLLTQRYAHLMVCRTFSKARGLPGIRVGYSVGSPEVLHAMRLAGGPYSVSAPSVERALMSILQEESELQRYCERIKYERQVLTQHFLQQGFDVVSSQANFILIHVPDREFFIQKLQEHHVVVKVFHKENLTNACRITCPGDEQGFNRLMEALQ